MQIQNFSVFVPKLNKKSLNIQTFKGNSNIQDTFEPSVEEKKKKFEEAKVKNPNTAFFYNPDLTYEQKVAELKKHPEIKPVRNVLSGFKFDSYSVKDDIFEFDVLEKPVADYRSGTAGTKISRMRYIDTENPVNKETISRLNQKKKDLYDYQQYTLKVDMPEEIFRRYLEIGRMERFEVYPERVKTKGRHSQIIDITSEKNKRAVENYKKLNPRSEFLDKLLKCGSKDKVYANILKLNEFGISDYDTIIKCIKAGKIDGVIKKTEKDGKQKYAVAVDLNSPKSQRVLSAIRRKNCMEVKEFSKKYNISVSEIEDAYFEDKIDFYPKALFVTDWGSQYIDMKSARNVEFITQKLLEREIENEILKKQKKSAVSAKMKIAWYLSPNTRKIAKDLAEGNDYLASIVSKKERIEEQMRKAEENPILADSDEEEEPIETLTEKEKSILLGFYKRMWEQAGTEEYRSGLKQAAEIMKAYKSSGINAVEDENIRKIILENIGE